MPFEKIASILRAPGWLLIAALIILTCAFGIHRSVVIVEEGVLRDQLRDLGTFDNRYNVHPVLSFLHIVPGVVFFLLGPLQFMRRIRSRRLNLHRWMGRVYLVSGLLAGISAMALAAVFPAFGGWKTASATYVFGIFLCYCLVRAYFHIRRRETLLHREWMIRGFAIGLAVGTIRVVLLTYSLLTGGSPDVFFGDAFWIAFLLNATVAEGWILLTRPAVSPVAAPLQSRLE